MDESESASVLHNLASIARLTCKATIKPTKAIYASRCIRGGRCKCMGPCGTCWGFRCVGRAARHVVGPEMCLGGAGHVSGWGRTCVWMGLDVCLGGTCGMGCH